MTILQLLPEIFSRKLQGTRQMLPLFFPLFLQCFRQLLYCDMLAAFSLHCTGIRMNFNESELAEDP